MNWFAEILENYLKDDPERRFIFDEKTPNGMTIKEFYDLSGRVYAYLKSKNIGKEDFVLVNLERGIKSVVAMMGVFRAGAAVIITENTDPIERVRYIYENSSCKLEITETLWNDIIKTEPRSGYENVDEHDAAYAVYTSGTTGKPKGVLHEYGNLKETCDSAYCNGKPIFSQDENFAFISSMNFATLNVFFVSIFNQKKSKFHIVPTATVKDPDRLISFLKEKEITDMFISPSYVKAIGERRFSCLKKIIIGAEPLKDAMPIGDLEAYNFYSMSESAIFVFLFKIDKYYKICPIGKPTMGEKLFLLDENGDKVSDGEVGEICFENLFVRGYIGLPEENKQAFQNGIYHTNDLAKRLSNGNYVILGRKCDMVKINGNRVEPLEVEIVVKEVLNISWCGVRGFEDVENAYLVAYYTDDIPPVDIDEVRKKLSKKLPYYMLPSHFIKIDKIPVNKNGKFDRKSLPAPELKSQEIVLPKTDFEKQIFDIVSRELETKEFGVTTNLISMGLTSIKAIKISSLIKKEINFYIKTSDILATPYIKEWINFTSDEDEKIKVLAPLKTYPLTSNQLGIYIDWERNKESLQYNIPMAFKLNNIEPKKLLASLEKLIKSYPYFKVRLKFDNDGNVVQERRDNEKLKIVCQKLESEPSEDFFQQRIKPFDLFKDDLSRFEIYYVNDATYLFFDIHHILFDGTSANIFLSKLFKCYNENNLEKEDVTAYDYSLFYKNWLQSKNYNVAENYFSNLISDTASFSYPSLNANATSTGESETYINKIKKNDIEKYCLKSGITENAFFASVLTQVFHRISREEKIEIVTISSGRGVEQLSNTIGMFVQTLPLVSRNSKGRIEDILHSMQEQIISTIRNDKFPYTELVEKYNVQPNVLYAYQGDVFDNENLSKIKQMELKLDTVKIPLSINITPIQDKYNLVFEYDKGLYSKEEIERLSQSISNFASNLIKEKTEAKIETVSLVLKEDEKELIKLGTGEKLDFDKSKTFVDLFLKEAKANPDAISVVDYKSKISYGELDRQTNILADELIKQGIKRDDFVAIKLPRIKEFMLAVIAIWKAGGAYVPIDPEYPQARIQYMIEDSTSKIIIDEEFLSRIDFSKEAKAINLANPQHLAYMIYTSGSTGKPKGVMVSHLSLLAFVTWLPRELELKRGEAVAEFSSFSFDASFCDLYTSISSGASLHILGKDLIRDFDGIEKYIKDNKIVGVTLPTQLGMDFLNHTDTGLRYIILGGEKLKLTKETSIKIYNGYGPTEFTVWASFHIVDFKNDLDNIPIGCPVPNATLAVIDENGNLLKRGMVGEVALIGLQIARGYWNREELTKEKFIDCPFIENEKMYKTGDLAYWNESGELQFIGRVDNQIKLRGFRIELGEIEETLSKISGIKSCIVDIKVINDVQHLIAYYVSNKELDCEILKQTLAKSLTEYMVPNLYVRLDKLPFTPNGKVDKKALPIPELKAQEIVLPKTDFEKQIFDIVSNELQIKEFGITTNLITMGLTSIKAIKISSLIKKETNFHIRTSDILATPYIKKWVSLIKKKDEKIKISAPLKTYPLTSNQLGIAIDCQRNKKSLQYNIPMVLKLDGNDPQKLLDCLNRVINAYPYFKVHIKINETGEVVQERRDDENLKIIFKKLDSELPGEFFQQRVRPFDLLKDDLARFEIYYTDETTYFFFDMHHIIFDGISISILLKKLDKCYEDNIVEQEEVTAYDYSLYYQKWLKSENYNVAKDYFSNLVSDVNSFKYLSPGGNGKATGASATYSTKIKKDGIKKYCLELGITENAFFAGVLTQVFHRISREEKIQIATVSSGRELEELSGTIGMFVQTVPLVSQSSKGKIKDILNSIQEQIIETINNDKFPYTELVEQYNIKPNVLYVYQGDVINSEALSEYNQIELKLDTVKLPLSIMIRPIFDRYDLIFEYDKGLYKQEEIERLAKSIINFASNLIQEKIDAKIETVSIVSKEEENELIKLGTGEKLDFDKTKTFVDLFLNQVKKNPYLISVLDYKSKISYEELDKKTNILANELIKKGIKPNDFVVVKLPRIKEFVIAVIGIWKAGGAYVPIDLAYPQERIQYMILDSTSKVIIDEEFLSHIDFSKEAKAINLASPQNLAYMIYTSGSTGKPKGVMISHLSLLSFISWQTKLLQVSFDDVFAHYVSFSFDASIVDMVTSITSGVPLHILNEETRTSLEALHHYITKNKITTLTLPTKLGIEFANKYRRLHLKYLTMGGEKITNLKETSYHIINGYGPTEFTVSSSCHIIDFKKESKSIKDIPIGRPAPNTISAIIDENGNLVERGMAGELVLIGDQISRGYWNKPELTKEKFVDCPFIENEKMYKTGDLIYWNENGELQFIGRVDNQIKLRGYRIELEEIESVLSKVVGIKSCVVDIKTINDVQHLVGYYVSEKLIDEGILKQKLSKSLTEYMVPDIFIWLAKMPSTPNGKIDRKALPSPLLENSPEKYVAPQTKTEKIICDIYGKILKIKNYSVTNDFFKSGGTSITAIAVVGELQKNNFNVVYGDVFKYKTPRDLAYYIKCLTVGYKNLINTFDFGDYDYTKINLALQKTNIDLSKDIKTHSLGNIILTGVTGFLGIHVLRYLLKTTKDKICVLVRSKDNLNGRYRFLVTYYYYFGEALNESEFSRVKILDGDITDTNLHDKLAVFHYDTVINCAALVKHYISDDKLDSVNVEGVRNLIECCSKDNATLIQISTASVSAICNKHSIKTLDEHNLYVGQISSNDYIRTKFLAERYLLEAIAQGRLKGKIMRLGNLMGRQVDGEFQMNFQSNAFVNLLKTYTILGMYPQNRLNYPIEMSPIEQVAEAVVRLAGTPENMLIFHPYNEHSTKMSDVLEGIQKIGYHIDYVEEKTLVAKIKEFRNNAKLVKYLQGILHYDIHRDNDNDKTKIDNSWTTEVLHKLGFNWSYPDEQYLLRFLQLLERMNFFHM